MLVLVIAFHCMFQVWKSCSGFLKFWFPMWTRVYSLLLIVIYLLFFPIHFLFDCRHLSIEHVRDHILLVWKILPSPSLFKTLTFNFWKLWNRENPMMQKLSLCEKNTIKGLQLSKGRYVFHEFLFLFMI